ncbi:MAG: hypothetical protein ABR591_12020 [Candidatus Velthaea sp.]
MSASGLYDPRGVVRAQHRATAARIVSASGLRVGVLDNTKWNGWKLLERTMALLSGDTAFAHVRRYKKESFSRNADPALIERIAAENDIALTGIGD